MKSISKIAKMRCGVGAEALTAVAWTAVWAVS